MTQSKHTRVTTLRYLLPFLVSLNLNEPVFIESEVDLNSLLKNSWSRISSCSNAEDFRQVENLPHVFHNRLLRVSARLEIIGANVVQKRINSEASSGTIQSRGCPHQGFYARISANSRYGVSVEKFRIGSLSRIRQSWLHQLSLKPQ